MGSELIKYEITVPALLLLAETCLKSKRGRRDLSGEGNHMKMEEEHPPTRILIAVNEATVMSNNPHPSISCRGAFEWTLDHIVRSNFSGFSLLFLNVQPTYEQGFEGMMDGIYTCPDDFRQLASRNKARSVQLLEYFVDRCHALGIACEAWIKMGDPTVEICGEARRVQPDFVVVGSRRHASYRRAALESVSDHVEKYKECHVIVITRNAHEATRGSSSRLTDSM